MVNTTPSYVESVPRDNEIIVTIDDDLQNPPNEVPKLLTKLSEGYDVVYGTPLKESHGFMRDVASRITKIALQNAMGARQQRMSAPFGFFAPNCGWPSSVIVVPMSLSMFC